MGLRCKRCGSEERVRNGLMRSKQRYSRTDADSAHPSQRTLADPSQHPQANSIRK